MIWVHLVWDLEQRRRTPREVERDFSSAVALPDNQLDASPPSALASGLDFWFQKLTLGTAAYLKGPHPTMYCLVVKVQPLLAWYCALLLTTSCS